MKKILFLALLSLSLLVMNVYAIKQIPQGQEINYLKFYLSSTLSDEQLKELLTSTTNSQYDIPGKTHDELITALDKPQPPNGKVNAIESFLTKSTIVIQIPPTTSISPVVYINITPPPKGNGQLKIIEFDEIKNKIKLLPIDKKLALFCISSELSPLSAFFAMNNVLPKYNVEFMDAMRKAIVMRLPLSFFVDSTYSEDPKVKYIEENLKDPLGISGFPEIVRYLIGSEVQTVPSPNKKEVWVSIEPKGNEQEVKKTE